MNIFTKIQLIITQPRTFWQKINEAHESWADTLRAQFVIFLIVNIITLLGYYLFGRFQITNPLSQARGFTMIFAWITTHLAVSAILAPVVYLIGLFVFTVIGGLIIAALLYLFIKSYNSTASLLNVYKAFVYQAAIGIFLSILGIIPGVPSLIYGIVGIVFLFWQVYIFLIGVHILCGLTKRQSIISFLSAVACYIILSIIIFASVMFALVSGVLRSAHNASGASTSSFILSTTTNQAKWSDGTISFVVPTGWVATTTSGILGTQQINFSSADHMTTFVVNKTPTDQLPPEVQNADGFMRLASTTYGSTAQDLSEGKIDGKEAVSFDGSFSGHDQSAFLNIFASSSVYSIIFSIETEPGTPLLSASLAGSSTSAFNQILKSISFVQ